MRNPLLTLLLLTACAALTGLTACDVRHLRLRPVQLDLYTLYTNNCGSDTSGGLRQIYFDSYLLVISETNKFSLRETDIRNIDLSSNGGRFHVNFILKKNRRRDFRVFTTANSNTYIAVMVNGTVRNIARIREPVSNGRLQFESSLDQAPEIGRFIRLFLL